MCRYPWYWPIMVPKMIYEIHHDPDDPVPVYEGPIPCGRDVDWYDEPGRVWLPDGGHLTMTWDEYIQFLKAHWPGSITEREPCRECGR